VVGCGVTCWSFHAIRRCVVLVRRTRRP
jgi:hypothetical protein